MRPSPRRMQNFLRNKAEFYLKKGFSITVRVTYGKMTDVFGKTIFSQNSGTYERLDDLKWAYQTFVKEYV